MHTLPDTSELVITRKRKKWKFAHFDSWPNCFAQPDVRPEQWQQPLTIEVGAGTADLSVGLARRYPQRYFVAMDVKSDRLYTGAKIALTESLGNISFVKAHATHSNELFKPGHVEAIWVTFPDPFPRKRQAKHRLTHPAFLARYKQLLAVGGKMYFKTDNRPLFLWSLEQIIATGWQITELSFDLHASDLPHDYKITTFYERRFMAEDIPINFVAFRPL